MDGGSPLYAFDAAWTLERGKGPLAGADEAGRGAFAGPLVAAGVVLAGEEVCRLADSKTISPTRRTEVCEEVLYRAEALSVTAFPAWWIDKHGLGLANKQALRRAIELLGPRASCSLADGKLDLGPQIECLPRADGCSAAVAAASVVAKVLRDNAMVSLAEKHGEYGFERNRGYGTREHRLALSEVGPCRVHRVSYAGVGS